MKLSTTLNKNDLQISATARWILFMTTGWKDLHKMMQTKNHKEKPVQFKQLWICVLISFAKGPCCCKCNHTITYHCISNSCNKRMNYKSYHITYKESLIIINSKFVTYTGSKHTCCCFVKIKAPYTPHSISYQGYNITTHGSKQNNIGINLKHVFPFINFKVIRKTFIVYVYHISLLKFILTFWKSFLPFPQGIHL